MTNVYVMCQWNLICMFCIFRIFWWYFPCFMRLTILVENIVIIFCEDFLNRYLHIASYSLKYMQFAPTIIGYLLNMVMYSTIMCRSLEYIYLVDGRFIIYIHIIIDYMYYWQIFNCILSRNIQMIMLRSVMGWPQIYLCPLMIWSNLL